MTHQKTREENFAEFAKAFLMGGVSGTISKTVVAPIERVKLLLQVQHGGYTSINQAFRGIYRDQGVPAFWRGNMANVYRYFPTQALNFAVKERVQKVLVKADPNKAFWTYFGQQLLSGGISGGVSLFFVYPLDFARTRLAADMGRTPDTREFRSTWDVLRKTYSSNGVRAWYAGFPPSFFGIFVYRAAFFGIYDSGKQLIYGDDQRNASPLVSFAVGFLAETVAGLIAYPPDTVRRRMMMQTGKQKVFQSSWDCAKSIWTTSGYRGFFSGALSNIYRGVGGALVLVLYDQLNKYHFK